MNIEHIDKMKELLSTLGQLENIKNAMEEESGHWWSFIAPDVKRQDDDGLCFPSILRKEFAIIVDKCIEKIKSDIEKL
jgi:hypothetical protein